MDYTSHAVLVAGVPQPLPSGDIVTGGVTHPRAILGLWTVAQLRAIGVYEIAEGPIPSGKVSTGWTLEKSGNTVTRVHTLADAPPPPPPPVPEEISDRQFAHALAKPPYLLMTEEEALAFVRTGTLSPALEALVEAMPEESRFDVRMYLSGATVFQRLHPATGPLIMAFGWNETQRDDFWRFAAAL